MVLKCCVPDCPGTGTTLYRFPIPGWETLTLRCWVDRIASDTLFRQDENRIYNMYRVCDLHFSKYCRVADKTRLKKGSLPTLLMPGYNGKSNAITSQIETFLELQEDEKLLHEEIDIKSEIVSDEEIVECDSHNNKFNCLKSYSRESRQIREVCRICFTPNLDKDLIKLYEGSVEQGEEVKNMLLQVLPGIDLELYPNSAVCVKCKSLLASSVELWNTWQTTEDKIKRLIENQKEMIIYESDLVIVEEIPGVLELSDHNYTKKPKLSIKDIQVSKSSGVRTSESICASLEGRKVPIWGAGPYLCELCGLSLTKLTSFRSHLGRHGIKGSGPRPIMCELCGQIIHGVHNFKRHIHAHNRSVHKCDSCNQVFTKAKFLHCHNRDKHFKLYHQCHICGKRMQRKSSLKTHLLIHGAKKTYACDKCGRKFLLKGALRRHVLKHNDVKLKCEYCGKLIKQKWYLQTHIKMYHTKEGKHTCEFCSRPFWKKFDLDRHRIKRHGWVPNSQGTQKD